jgi:hypothetical protein
MLRLLRLLRLLQCCPHPCDVLSSTAQSGASADLSTAQHCDLFSSKRRIGITANAFVKLSIGHLYKLFKEVRHGVAAGEFNRAAALQQFTFAVCF